MKIESIVSTNSTTKLETSVSITCEGGLCINLLLIVDNLLPNDSAILNMLNDIEFSDEAYLRDVLKEIYSGNVVTIREIYNSSAMQSIINNLQMSNSIYKRILTGFRYYIQDEENANIMMSFTNKFGKKADSVIIKVNPKCVKFPENFIDYTREDPLGASPIGKSFDSRMGAVKSILDELGLRIASIDEDTKVITAENGTPVKIKKIGIEFGEEEYGTIFVNIESATGIKRIYNKDFINPYRFRIAPDIFSEIQSIVEYTETDYFKKVKEILKDENDSTKMEEVK